MMKVSFMNLEILQKAEAILLDKKAPQEIREKAFLIIKNQKEKQEVSGAQTSVLKFAQHMYNGYSTPAHVQLIAKSLEALERDEFDRLAIFMPPRHGKSMLCSEMFPAWFLGRNPKNFVIQSTYAQELADDFGRKVRNHVKSEEFTKVFPNTTLREDSTSAKRFHTVQGGTYSAVGAGGAITGRGAHLLIIDDPIKGREDAESQVQRRNLIEWYKSVAFTRLMPGGKVIIIQTRWHEEDLAGWVLENEPGAWKVLDLPAVNDNGDALWPEAYPIEKLKKIQSTVGERVWQSLYQQKPSAEQGQILKRDWWCVWEKKRLPACHTIVQSWDTAFSAKETADYSARTTWGVFTHIDEEGRDQACIILLELWRNRVEYPELRKEAQQSFFDWKPDVVLVEKRASGQSLLQDLRRAGVPVKEFTPDRDKVSRAHVVASMLETGLVFVLNEAWVDDLIQECASFPYGKHDDLVDTTTQAWQLIRDNYLVSHPLDPEDEEWDDKPYRLIQKKSFYS